MTAKSALLAGLCAFVTAANAVAGVENYDYPFTDRYVATVLGTPSAYRAELPDVIPDSEPYAAGAAA